MRLKKSVTLTVAGMMACALAVSGLAGCSSADTRQATIDGFVDAFTAGDPDAMKQYLPDGVKLFEGKPSKPISDVTVGEVGDNDIAAFTYKSGKHKLEKEITLLKDGNGGWKVGPDGVLPMTFDNPSDMQQGLTLDGKKLDANMYVIPGVYKAKVTSTAWTSEWDERVDDATANPRYDPKNDNTITLDEDFTTNETVVEATRSVLTGLDACHVLDMQMGNWSSSLIGGNFEKLSDKCREGVFGGNGGSGIVDASGVTISKAEQTKPNSGTVTVTLAGSFTGAKAEYRDASNRLDLGIDWACYPLNDNTSRQCARFYEASLPADGLTVALTLDGENDTVTGEVTDESMNSVLDLLYAGHGDY